VRRSAAVLLAGVVLLAGCGGGNGREVLQKTAARLGKIRSGTLDLRLVIDPRGKSAHGKIGFIVHGPFALRRRGALPLLDVTYTQLAGTKRATAKLVSDGNTAYAESDGRRVTLTGSQLDELRSATAQVETGGGLAQFPIDDWIKDPSVSDGGDVGGASTDHVTADLDVVRVTNDLIALARGLGARGPQLLRGNNAKQLQDSVNDTSFDLWTGKNDRLLRRLELEADFGFDVPQELARALGDVVGAKVTFELAVTNPNKPITVG
jgi:hypothetical protein